MAARERAIGRRALLRAGAVVIATIAIPGCASLFVKKRNPDVTVAAPNGEARVPVTAAPWVRSGQGTLAIAITGREDKILVFRGPDGALTAVDMTCTHRGCDVGYASESGRLECPCHGSKFAPTGAVLEGPAERPLRTYPVEVLGPEIVVLVG
jgi:cytochrome b6-f complex iron-sulfur subunit